MKKLILLIATIFCFSGLLMAEEEGYKLTGGGDIWSTLTSNTAKSGDTSAATLFNSTYALIGFEMTKPYMDYVTKAVLSFETVDFTPGVYQVYAGLESKSMSYKMGIVDPGDVTQGLGYLPFFDARFYIGVLVAQGNFLTVGLNDYGLDFALGFNNIAHKVDHESLGDESNKTVDQTVIGIYYRNEWDALSLGASYVSVDNKLDTVKDPSTDAMAYGNYSDTQTSLGIGYAMGDLGLALNTESLESKADNGSSVSESKLNLSLDYTLFEGTGITIANSSISTGDGTSAKTMQGRTELGLAHGYGDLQTGIAYFTDTTKDDDTKQDDSNSGIVLGFYMGF